MLCPARLVASKQYGFEHNGCNYCKQDGETALTLAYKMRQHKCASVLLSLGADVNLDTTVSGWWWPSFSCMAFEFESESSMSCARLVALRCSTG